MKLIGALGLAAVCVVTVALPACSRSNNLLLGRVEMAVGAHTVVVTDCYRTSVTPPERIEGAGQPAYRWTPCRDADVLIRGGELLVNGRSYGSVAVNDAILVDHGIVSINRREPPPNTSK